MAICDKSLRTTVSLFIFFAMVSICSSRPHQKYKRSQPMPSCVQDTELCPYNSTYRAGTLSDEQEDRSLSPWYYWRTSIFEAKKVCCACTYCVDPNDSSKPLLGFYSEPVVSGDGVKVGCTCVKPISTA